jgi:hypothetical protein
MRALTLISFVAFFVLRLTKIDVESLDIELLMYHSFKVGKSFSPLFCPDSRPIRR